MFFLKENEWSMHLDKGTVAAISAGSIDIACVRGLIWITWPGSGDVILREGDEIAAVSKGNFCLTAFSESYVQVKKRVPLKHLPLFACRRIFSAALSLIKSEDPAFGGSVHSITR